MKGRCFMIHIRPISDLRNKFTEIEKIVSEGQPVYLTKNGYGCMVVTSIEYYCAHFAVNEEEIVKAIAQTDKEDRT